MCREFCSFIGNTKTSKIPKIKLRVKHKRKPYVMMSTLQADMNGKINLDTNSNSVQKTHTHWALENRDVIIKS